MRPSDGSRRRRGLAPWVLGFALLPGLVAPLLLAEEREEAGSRPPGKSLAPPPPEPVFGGPLAFKNLHPFYLPFYHPSTERAHTLPRGVTRLGLHLGYASLQRADQSGRDFSFYDGEILRTALHLRHGLLEGLELSAEIPFITGHDGFLDPVIKGFHNSTGLTDDQRRDYRYRERVFIDNRDIINEPPRDFHLGDVTVQLKGQVLEDGVDPFGLSLRGALDLPTGRSVTWAGSGKLEGGVGILAEKTLGELTLFLSADLRVLHAPRRLEELGLEFRSTPAFGVTLQWRARPGCLFLLQLEAAENLVDGGDLELFEKNYLQMGLGMRFRVTSALSASLGFFEDFEQVTAPDVTFQLNLHWEIDRG